MWRVDDYLTHDYVFYYWICRSDVSVISFRLCLFSTIVFDLVIVDFDLFLPVGDRFFQSDDGGTINKLLGLDKISK